MEDKINLFFLDNDPVKAAQFQCDKHITKMVVESGQLLSVTHRIVDNIDEFHPLHPVLYRATHANHPSAKWTMESGDNYDWHYNHFVALCDEYTYRYGKKHLTDTKLRDALKNRPANIPDIGLTPFKLGMHLEPDEIVADDMVETYRRFYQTKQDRFKMRWTKREKPDWFNYKDKTVDVDRFLDLL